MKKSTILLVLASAAMLASCGGGSSSSQGGSTSQSQPSTSQGGGQSSPTQESKINLTIDKATIKVGETAKVTSDVEGVEFSSRDESIATVDANGVVTALKVGETKIQARKDGYKVGSVDIKVEKADAKAADFYLEFEDAEHYDPDGFWGMEFMGTVYGPGDTPIEETEMAHGGKSVGWFTADCKETIYFTSDKAGKVEMDFMFAYNADMPLDGVITISVNGKALSLSGKSVLGPSDGDGNNYYDFNPINFKDIDVIAGENTIVVEALQQGPNMDCVQVYTKELKIEQIPVVPVILQNLEGDFSAVRLEKGASTKLSIVTTGVSFVSSDSAIASVDTEGVVTGVEVGSAVITVSKEGYKNGTINVTVYQPAQDEEGVQYLEFEDGEHYIEGGEWGFPSIGWSFNTPVEESDTSHGGKHVGWFTAGCKETIRFSSDSATTCDMDFMFARNQDMPLEGVITITVNGVSLDMTGKVVKGPSDNDTNNYTDFNAISWTSIALKAGPNEIVVEAFDQGPNMDCVKVKNTTATIQQTVAE